jgi:YVTN family beta-propeller protein
MTSPRPRSPRNAHARPARLVAVSAVLASTLGALVGVGPASAVPTAPVYVRTIGVPGQSEMYPSGLDVDNTGNVVVADTGNDRVTFYPAGSSTPSWSVGVRGNPVGGSPPTGFQNPRDVAVDGTRVYVADTDNNAVQVLDKSDGSFIAKIAATFSSPIGVSVGTDGAGHERILVSNGGTGAVSLFNSSLASVGSIPALTANAGTRDAATDSNGNVYVADYRNNRIVKFSPAGSVLTMWGGAGAPTCQQIPKPYGVDVDDANHVYVATSNLSLVKEFQPNGSCISPGTANGAFGVKGSGATQLLQLRRVAVGPGASPVVFAADLWGLKILTYASNGSLGSLKLGTGTYPAAGGLNEPHGVAVSGGYVYVTDMVNQRIQRFDLDGSNPIMWGDKGVAESSASFNWAQGIGFNPNSGNVWVANTRNNRLDEFPPGGAASPLRLLGTRTGGGTANFYWPMDVVFGPGGRMFVADTFNHRIQAFDVSPTSITHLWTTGGLGAGAGEFNRPFSLTYDDTGATPRLLVADTRNTRVVSLNANTGAWNGVLPIAKGTAVGKIRSPRGIAVMADGSIWISDSSNNRIEKFNADGTFANVLVGGLGSANDRFNFPQRMRVAGGLLYVADAFNNRIQVFEA